VVSNAASPRKRGLSGCSCDLVVCRPLQKERTIYTTEENKGKTSPSQTTSLSLFCRSRTSNHRKSALAFFSAQRPAQHNLRLRTHLLSTVSGRRSSSAVVTGPRSAFPSAKVSLAPLPHPRSHVYAPSAAVYSRAAPPRDLRRCRRAATTTRSNSRLPFVSTLSPSRSLSLGLVFPPPLPTTLSPRLPHARLSSLSLLFDFCSSE